MATPRQILVNQLLLEREALWVRVHEIEREAAKWLGEPYPFERPELPSDRRKKRRSTAASASAAAVDRPDGAPGVTTDAGATEPAGATPERLRRLEPGEAGYRVSYVIHGRGATEEHDELDALRVMVGSQGATLRVTRIETLDENGTVRATLFPR